MQQEVDQRLSSKAYGNRSRYKSIKIKGALYRPNKYIFALQKGRRDIYFVAFRQLFIFN